MTLPRSRSQAFAPTFAVGTRLEQTISLRQVIERLAIERAGGDDFTRSLAAEAASPDPAPAVPDWRSNPDRTDERA